MNDHSLRNNLMKAIDDQVKSCFKFKSLRNSSTGGACIRSDKNYAYSKFEVVDEIFFKGCHYEWHVGKEERLSLAYHVENSNIRNLVGDPALRMWGNSICQGLSKESKGLKLFNRSPSDLGRQHFNCRSSNSVSHYWWVGVDVGNINVIHESVFRRSEVILLSDLVTRVVEDCKRNLLLPLLSSYVGHKGDFIKEKVV